MPLITLPFLMGVLILQSCSNLPSIWAVLILLLMGLLLWLTPFKKYLKIFVCITLGFSYTYFYSVQVLNASLPHTVENQAVKIIGEIQSIPLNAMYGQQFIFKVKRLNDEELTYPLTVRMTWKTEQVLHVGDEWRLTAKLKRIHGQASEAAFNYEAWAFEKGISATGFVVVTQTSQWRRARPYLYPVESIREWIHYHIRALPNADTFSPWIEAVTIGVRSQINAEDWSILRKTGTNHLMAIAGLHIGFITEMSLFLFRWSLGFFPALALWMPRNELALLLACLMGIAYSSLSGFSIPAQRAALMMGLSMILYVRRSVTSRWNILFVALLIILLGNPNAVLSESIWLSFLTIALIIYGMAGRLHEKANVLQQTRIQWVMSLGLIPITLFFYQQASFSSFLANMVAVPFLGFLILPASLLGVIFLGISPFIANHIFLGATYLLNTLMMLLGKIAAFNQGVWFHALPSYWMVCSVVFGMLLFLLPKGVKARWCGSVFVLPLFISTSQAIKEGDLAVTILDVGQGLSVFLQTAHHTMLYDVGPGSKNGINMGEAIILPYLHSQQIKKIDSILISHGDNDHIGGLGPILDEIPVDEIKTSEVDKVHLYQTGRRYKLQSVSGCERGETWQWDGVKFEILSPDLRDKENLLKRNDLSCVLKVTSRLFSLLLPGDIEQKAEKLLVSNEANHLAATFLIAPHHGSKTSINEDFIRAVNPRYVIYSTAYLNRYHFPHPATIDLYHARQVVQLNTVNNGSLKIEGNRAGKLNVIAYRLMHPHYWSE